MFYAIIIRAVIPPPGIFSQIFNRVRIFSVPVFRVSDIDLNNTGSRIHMTQVKPAEMTNLEYQDGGQSAFSIDK